MPEKPKPPTIPELRSMLKQLEYEIGNRGGTATNDGRFFAEAYEQFAWLVYEYLFGEDD